MKPWPLTTTVCSFVGTHTMLVWRFLPHVAVTRYVHPASSTLYIDGRMRMVIQDKADVPAVYAWGAVFLRFESQDRSVTHPNRGLLEYACYGTAHPVREDRGWREHPGGCVRLAEQIFLGRAREFLAFLL